MDQDRQYYRQKLEAIRNRILDELGTESELSTGEQMTTKEATGELSSYDNHPADSGNMTFEQEKNLGLDGRVRSVLQMIDDALKRLEAGDYGQCDSCGQAISEARLKTMPYSTMCIDCKREWEAAESEANSERPLEEKVLANRLAGLSASIDQDYNGYDGQDSWQDLARMGSSNSPSDTSESPPAENN